LPSADFESDFRGFAGHCKAPHKIAASVFFAYRYQPCISCNPMQPKAEKVGNEQPSKQPPNFALKMVQPA
jgi:hypothetical protein